jgi:hypothetical protein
LAILLIGALPMTDSAERIDLPLTRAEADRLRQWYNALQDTASAYLEPADRELATRIYQALGWADPGRPGRAADSPFWLGYAAGARGAQQSDCPPEYDFEAGRQWELGRLKAFGEGLSAAGPDRA